MLTRDEFKKLYKRAGFKNKNELARFLHLAHSTINAWGGVTHFPAYVKPLLESMIKARKYDELISKGLIPHEFLES